MRVRAGTHRGTTLGCGDDGFDKELQHLGLGHNVFGKGRPWRKKVRGTIIFLHLTSVLIFMGYLNSEGAQQSRHRGPSLRLYDINDADKCET